MRMKMGLEIFKILREIAEERGISQVAWAKAAGTHQPRISELVQLEEGKEPADARLFTLDKFIQLYRGLAHIIGEGTLKDEFSKKIAEGPDTIQRLWAKLGLLIESSDDRGLEDLERMLDLFLSKK